MAGWDDPEADPHIIEIVDATDTNGEGDDAITLHRPRTEWWRIERSRYLIAAVFLIAAVIVAYQIGSNAHTKQKATRTPSISRPATAVSSSVIDRTPAIAETGQLCAIQIGQRLQLGVEVVNQSATKLTLMTLTATLPVGGLRAAAQARGTCGQLTLTAPVAGTELAPGASTWTTMTFDVLVDCPSPYPVQFVFVIAKGGQSSTVTVGGFPDLGGVSYSRCTAGA